MRACVVCVGGSCHTWSDSAPLVIGIVLSAAAAAAAAARGILFMGAVVAAVEDRAEEGNHPSPHHPEEAWSGRAGLG